MAEFSVLGFAEHLTSLQLAMPLAANRVLTEAAILVQAEAKREIGLYQSGWTPFKAWAPLADWTRQDRRRQGFPEDEPLLRTGALRDRILYRAGTQEAVIGSDSWIAVYQELGTPGAAHPIPARSFLGMAAARMSKRVLELLGPTAIVQLLRLDRASARALGAKYLPTAVVGTGQ